MKQLKLKLIIMLFSFLTKRKKENMEWVQLQTEQDLEKAIQDSSNQQSVLLFKHSTRCSISSTALSRLERNWNNDAGVKAYFLDLISYRNISNKIADVFGVIHQSPQALVIKDGKCIYDASHMEINASIILDTVNT